MKTHRIHPLTALVLLTLCILHSALCTCSAQYSIGWFKVAGGGGVFSTNGQYAATGTVGQQDASPTLSGGQYAVASGFWSVIAVVQSIGSPLLTIAHTQNTVTISWPSPSAGFTLQQNPSVSSGTWTNSNYTVSDNGTNRSITITSPTGQVFFRLLHP